MWNTNKTDKPHFDGNPFRDSEKYWFRQKVLGVAGFVILIGW